MKSNRKDREVAAEAEVPPFPSQEELRGAYARNAYREEVPPPPPPKVETLTLVEDPEIWEAPAPNNWIDGVFHSIVMRNGPYGPYEQMFLRDSNGKLRVVIGSHLVTLAVSAGIKAGEKIRVMYVGMTSMPSGARRKQFNLFRHP